MLVSRAAKRKFNTGDEVMWTYNITAKNRKMDRDFYPETEWKLKCCSESDGSLVKQPKRHSYHLERRSVGVKSFRPCTYCGQNLAEVTKPGSKINIKCHLALKHAVDLCGELAGYNCPRDLVSAKLFIQHLDMVVNVFNALNNMNYKIVPACKFFEITGTPMLHPDAPQEEREQVFHAFEEEGRKEGFSDVPGPYEDLLVSTNTTYSDINWTGVRPSNIDFSLSSYSLTEEEERKHALEIKSNTMKAVLMWN
ncbi:DNA-directed RNA polymerase subunit alpha [Frankliniella fusca]|uniref:DNA-directed RNA polymerase subunit alpha n=1 Tax=Frankliniella fusca TaxID=407009 RepID=A0AAE1LIJ2_9NEOP|nr:DNA-directed RNA polymerase subunit alpha [Frankliniella fusca]